MSQPKALLFDCFGLFAPDPMVTFFKQRFGLDSMPLKDRFCAPGDLGEVSFAEVLENMHKELGVDPQDVLRHIQGLEPSERMINLVKRMKRHTPCYLLTNCMPGFLEEFFQGTDFFSCFDKIYRSYEIHKIKPHPDFFEYVLTDLSLKSSEVLFVDDNPDNVAAAKSLGIDSILYDGFVTFNEELYRRGL